MPREAGLQKRANFPTLIIGLAGTGDQTRATCVAGSGANHSAIQYHSGVEKLSIRSYSSHSEVFADIGLKTFTFPLFSCALCGGAVVHFPLAARCKL
jgi:hypothetical protein